MKSDCEALLRQASARLRALLKEKRKVDYDVAVILHEVWKKKLWVGRHASFSAYVRAEGGGMTERYATLHTRMINRGFTREQFHRIGMSKLARLLMLPPSPEASKLLAVAHQLTRAEILESVDAIRGVCRKPIGRVSKQVVLLGDVAQSLIRLSTTMGVTPQKYVELMVIGAVRRAG